MPAKVLKLKDPKKINVFRHPVRYEIWQLMRAKCVPMTVKMIADEMNVKHGNIFYHVKKLHNNDFIEVVKTKKINGITAKYYLRKYDNIYYEIKNLAHESDKLLVEFNQSIFKIKFSDFLRMVFPNEMNLEDADLVDDALRTGRYYFDPKDTEKIKQEMITILRKHDKGPDEGVAYSSIIAIGKRRKDIYKLIDDIKIED